MPTSSQMIETTVGTVEVAISGHGPAILVVHGGGGGYDQGLLLTDWLPKRFKRICPSRPGYLRTPAAIGTTALQQADMLNALLDALYIDNAIIITTSGGGGPSYELAINYPDKVNGIVALDALTGHYVMPNQASWLAQKLFLTSTGEKILEWIMKKSPKSVVAQLYKTESLLNVAQRKQHTDAVLADPKKMNFIMDFMAELTQFAERKMGIDIEMDYYSQMPTHLPLEKITAPTFVVHGTHDADVLFYHGVYAAQTIANARYLWIHQGSHLCFYISDQARDAQQQVLAFIDGLA